MNRIHFKHSYKRKNSGIFLITFTVMIGLVLGYEGKLAAGEIEPHKDLLTTAKFSTYEEVIYTPAVYVYDDEMEQGEKVVERERVAGSREVTVMAVYYRGKEVDNKVLDKAVIRQPEPEIIRVGTYIPPEYIEPVSNYFITSEFGPRWGRNHNGVDLAVVTGTKVLATADGVCERSSWYNGYGLCVDIRHENGVLSRYAHLSKPLVQVGDTVSQGDVIAYSGSTGNSTGPHLHFELIFDGVAKNPLDYIEKAGK